jgi:hypothetical protein
MAAASIEQRQHQSQDEANCKMALHVFAQCEVANTMQERIFGDMAITPSYAQNLSGQKPTLTS